MEMFNSGPGGVRRVGAEPAYDMSAVSVFSTEPAVVCRHDHRSTITELELCHLPQFRTLSLQEDRRSTSIRDPLMRFMLMSCQTPLSVFHGADVAYVIAWLQQQGGACVCMHWQLWLQEVEVLEQRCFV